MAIGIFNAQSIMKKFLIGFLLFLAFLSLILGGVFWYLFNFAKDEEPLDYSDWVLDPIVISEEENGYEELSMFSELESLDDYKLILMLNYLSESEIEYETDEEVDLASISDFIDAEAGVFNDLDSVLSYEYFYSPFMLDPSSVSWENDGRYFSSSDYLVVSQLAQIEFLHAVRTEGDDADNDRFLLFLDFYGNYVKSIDTIRGFFVYSNFDELKETFRYLFEQEAKNESILAVAEYVSDMEVDFDSACRQAIEAETTQFIFSIDRLKENADHFLHKSAFHFKPNMTKNIYYSGISNPEFDFNEFFESFKFSDSQIVAYGELLLTENSIGNAFLLSFIPDLNCFDQLEDAKVQLELIKEMSAEYVEKWDDDISRESDDSDSEYPNMKACPYIDVEEVNELLPGYDFEKFHFGDVTYLDEGFEGCVLRTVVDDEIYILEIQSLEGENEEVEEKIDSVYDFLTNPIEVEGFGYKSYFSETDINLSLYGVDGGTYFSVSLDKFPDYQGYYETGAVEEYGEELKEIANKLLNKEQLISR